MRLVDSTPIPISTYTISTYTISTYTHGRRCQSISLEWRDEWFGVCTSQKSNFFGARCHLTSTLDRMVDSWLLAPGSYEDRKPLIALLEERQALQLIADKGYLSDELDECLWEVGEHPLLALQRKNQKRLCAALAAIP